MLHEIALTIAVARAKPVCGAAPAPIVGTLCVPAGLGKHPAVILLGGSECGDELGKLAPMVAVHGYVALSVGYCGTAAQGAPLIDVPVEKVGAALNALLRRNDVESRHIAVLGGSKGGEFALLAASTYPQIAAVVADVPSPYAFMGLDASDQPSGCSWSKGGRALPCIPPDPSGSQQVGMAFATGKPVSLRVLYDASRLADPAQTRASMFALQNIAGPVLCLAASDDRMWNSPVQCDDAMTDLRAHHHRFADREIVYPDAGHTFLWAMHGPKSAVTKYSAGGATILLGGTPSGDVAAATSAWSTIWRFLARTFER